MESPRTLEQMLAIYSEESKAVDNYINDLLDQSGGDRDFAISQLKRQHELALGTDDSARATFLESVADKLEEKIGTIPYDYQVGTTRAKEDLATTTQLTERNKAQALSRLAEDEKVWKDQFGQESKQARVGQQEGLSQRGILQGTRAGAEGLAGEEVKTLEKGLSDILSSYERTLGRERGDISQSASDILAEAQRGTTRTLEDLKTAARRGATTEQDTLKYGTEAANRAAEARRKELERLRASEQASAKVSSVLGY